MMKNFITRLALVCGMIVAVSGVALATGGNELAYFKIPQLTTLAPTAVDVAADYVPVYDASAEKVKKVLASALSGGISNAEDTTATNVLTSAECGKLITLNSSTEFVTTLPAVTAGCRFTFYVKAAPSGASYTIVTDSSSNVMLGQVLTIDVNSATDADFEASGGDTLTLVDGKAVKGDRAMCESDGTNWFCTIQTSVFDGATITTAS